MSSLARVIIGWTLRSRAAIGVKEAVEVEGEGAYDNGDEDSIEVVVLVEKR